MPASGGSSRGGHKLTFTHPIYLLLLVPTLVGLVWSYRHVHGMMRNRKRLAFGIRFCLVAALIVALAGPESHRPNVGLCTIFLLDRSDSISDSDRAASQEFINESLKALQPQDQAAILAFGREPSIDMAPGKLTRVDRVLSVVDGSATDLAAAIRLASASFPDGKARRVVIFSDGNETSGDAVEAAAVASADGITVDHVPLGLDEKAAEVSVSDMELPSEIRTGQPFDVRLSVDSARAARGVLVLDRNGRIVKRQEVQLNPGRNSVVLSQVLDDAGFHKYRATLQVQNDSDNRNNVGMGFVAVRGKPRVLVLQEKRGASALAAAISKQGVTVDLYGPEGMPTRPEGLQPYDAVIFNDINAASMTRPQMEMLEAAVKNSGLGFAMVGGENSFLPGGWYGTAVADALPVDLNIRQRKTFPSTTILIVVDASGSMAMEEDGLPKIRLAAKAAEHTVNLLSPMDRVGVAGSTDGIELVAPIQKLTNKPAVISQVRKLDVGGGGIYCRPSMEFASEKLRAETTKVRHLILLADGADCDQQEGCIDIARAMRSARITTSVVAIGDGPHVPFLKQLAAAGGGRYYLAKRAGQLPAIFTQDAAVMSRSAIEDGAFLPKTAMGEEILRGIPGDSIPPLFAYCLTDSKPLARVGMRTQKDDPLLATWQYGLGSTLAFTSDAQPRWAARWVPWSGFNTFWAQAVRFISRRATRNDYQVSTRHDGSRGVIDIEAFDQAGRPMNELPAQVRVTTPDGRARDVVVSQTAPGKFRGTFEATDLGSYIVAVAEDDPAGGKRISSSGFSLPYPAEYRNYRSNRPLLQRLSSASGGIELKNPLDAVRPAREPGFSVQELWMFFVLLAALLLPLDIAARRVAIPVAEIWQRFIAWARSRRAVPVTATQTVITERLQKAKQRAATDEPEAPRPRIEIVSTDDDRPAAATGAPLGTASSKLLDAKRKRKEASGEDERP